MVGMESSRGKVLVRCDDNERGTVGEEVQGCWVYIATTRSGPTDHEVYTGRDSFS